MDVETQSLHDREKTIVEEMRKMIDSTIIIEKTLKALLGNIKRGKDSRSMELLPRNDIISMEQHVRVLSDSLNLIGAVNLYGPSIQDTLPMVKSTEHLDGTDVLAEAGSVEGERIPLCTINKESGKFEIIEKTFYSLFQGYRESDFLLLSFTGHSINQKSILVKHLLNQLTYKVTAVKLYVKDLHPTADAHVPGVYMHTVLFKKQTGSKQVIMVLIDIVEEEGYHITSEMKNVILDIYYNLGQILMYVVYRRIDYSISKRLERAVRRKAFIHCSKSVYVIVTSWINTSYGCQTKYLRAFMISDHTKPVSEKAASARREFWNEDCFALPHLDGNESKKYIHQLTDQLLQLCDSYAICFKSTAERFQYCINHASNWNIQNEKSKLGQSGVSTGADGTDL